MTEPYDPADQYRRDPNNPFRQGSPDQPPYGGPPYGVPYGGQPPPGPYQGGQPYQGQPPYQGQYGPYQGGQPDPALQYDPFGAQGHDPYRGQQPYQGSYGQPAGWGAPGGPPPQPPRKSRIPLVIIGVLAVLLLIGGGVAAAVALRGNNDPSAAPTSTSASAQPSGQQSTTGRRQTTTRPTTAAGDDFEVGQCATLTPQQDNRATIRVTACGGFLSDVVIAKVQGSECAEPYLSFDPGQGKVYCLAMDAKEGDCFKLDNLIKRAPACVGDETRKVVKIYDGVADDQQCGAVPQTIDVYAYPDPPKTLCLGKADF
jgi:hypothetical protein